MDYKFLKGLNLSDLNELKNVLSSSPDELLNEVLKNIAYKEGFDTGMIDFSSDRLPFYREENEGRCIELLDELTLDDVSFLGGAFCAREVNRMGPLLSSRIGDDIGGNFNLLTLENFFSDPYAIFCYEGVYNTLNYIKNQIYFYLLNNDNISKKDLTKDMEYKIELAKKHLSDIANYIYDIKKMDSQLKISTGNVGIVASRSRTDAKKTLSSYQRRFIQAVAFGTSCEKLENNNYEDCKRLLFIPRTRERKNR